MDQIHFLVTPVRETLNVDLDLLEKYDRRGPRYTSYPSAQKFTDSVGRETFRREMGPFQSTRDEAISLYVHIPFCPNRCLFCGCNTVITRNRDLVNEYLKNLYHEIRLIADRLPSGRRVAQLHWGGGTPSYLKPYQIEELMDTITNHFRLTDDPEISVELDPRGMNLDQMRTMEEAGFNRVSIGVQDFDPDVQEAVKRKQSGDETGRVVHWARCANMDSVNIDLIYGLPHQTPETFDRTLDRVIEMNPDRLAVYNYAHVPEMKPHQRAMPEDALPDPRTKLRLLQQSVERLTGAGYEFIGMDHFAKPDDELCRAQRNGTLHRNFQGYSTKAGLDLFGLGLSGISMLDRVYVQNVKRLSEYIDRIENDRLPTTRGYRLTDEDRLRRRVIMELMCNLELDTKFIERRYDIDFPRHFRTELDELRRFQEDELITCTDDRIRIHPEGRLVIRNICMAFDEYVKRKGEQNPTYSRTV